MSSYSVVIFLLVRVFFVSFFVFLLKEKVGDSFSDEPHEDRKLDELFHNWCRVRDERIDFASKLNTCNNNISWSSTPNDEKRKRLSTNAAKSVLFNFQINPAGQFSSFMIQSKTKDGKTKNVGGDSWRILIRGRSSVVPTIFDLNNGQYEVIFLMADPGVYKVEIVLDFSLCDGFRDPPSDWFIKGDAQGKRQPDGMLGGHAKKDYLMEKFQNGKEIIINIPLPKHEGFYLMHTQSELYSRYDPLCHSKCKYIWDGYGRWSNDNWLPYLRAINKATPSSRRPYSTLLVYGDSQADRMYQSLKNTAICTEIFKSCKVVKLWVYPYKSEVPARNDLDFEPGKLLQNLKENLQKQEMDENSVLLFNLGLHYLMGISFSSYQSFMRDVVQLVKSDVFKGRVLWKTTTALSKEKDTDDLLFADFKRFLNVPRVELFNSFSTKLMCGAGIEILDVYPLTRGFPDGAGGPEIGHYKEHDIVHFKNYVLKPVENVLEQYFRGQIPYPISFRNYAFL